MESQISVPGQRTLRLIKSPNYIRKKYVRLWKNADFKNPSVRLLWLKCTQDIFRDDEENNFFEFLHRVQAADDQEAMMAFLELAEDIKAKKRISSDQIDLVLKYGLKQMKGADLRSLIVHGSLENMDLREVDLRFADVRGRIFKCLFTNLIKCTVDWDVSCNEVEEEMYGNEVHIDISKNKVGANISYNEVGRNVDNNESGANISHNQAKNGSIAYNTAQNIVNNTAAKGEFGNTAKGRIFYNIWQYLKDRLFL